MPFRRADICKQRSVRALTLFQNRGDLIPIALSERLFLASDGHQNRLGSKRIKPGFHLVRELSDEGQNQPLRRGANTCLGLRRSQTQDLDAMLDNPPSDGEPLGLLSMQIEGHEHVIPTGRLGNVCVGRLGETKLRGVIRIVMKCLEDERYLFRNVLIEKEAQRTLPLRFKG